MPETVVATSPEIVPAVAPEARQLLVNDYRNRYAAGIPDEQASAADHYPHFPTDEDIKKRLETETSIELTTMLPQEAYATDATIPFPYAFTVTVPSEEWRAMFRGTDEKLETYYQAGTKPYDGLQLTNPALDPPEDEAKAWLEMAQEKTLESAVFKISRTMWWQNRDLGVDKDIRDGRLSQVFDLRKGDHVIQLVNCDRPMTEAEVEEIRQVVDKLAIASQDKLFDRLQTIIVQYDDRFNPHSRDDDLMVAGQAHPALKVFRLNSIIRDLAALVSASNEISPSVSGWTDLQSILAHELGHLLDLAPGDDRRKRLGRLATKHADPEEGHDLEGHDSVFLRPFGWYTKELHFKDAGGEERVHRVRGIQGYADELFVVDEKGKGQKVETGDHFTQAELDGSMPNTPYAHTNAREDFAEAFKMYALAGPEAVEPVRRAVIEHAMASLSTREPITFDPDTPVASQQKPLEELTLAYDVPTLMTFAVFVQGNYGWRRAEPWMVMGTDEAGLAKRGLYIPKQQ